VLAKDAALHYYGFKTKTRKENSMSNTNTAIKIAPLTDEEVAKTLRELRQTKSEIEDQIKQFSAILMERAAQREVTSFEAGELKVMIVHKKRQNFSLKSASENMDPEVFMQVIMPYTTESEWDEVHVK